MPAMSSLLFVLLMATHRAPVAFVLVLYVCIHAGSEISSAREVESDRLREISDWPW